MGGREEEEAGVPESVFTIINSVVGFRIGSVIGAEDFSDKVNYKWTRALIFMAAILVVMRDFIFKPIQCFTPPEWPHPWEEYAENYCWVQNNYHVSYMNASFPAASERPSLELNYYQWVPFVLLLEMLLVYLPHLVWRFLCVRSGLDPYGLIRLAKSSVMLSDRPKTKLVLHVVDELEEAMKLHADRSDGRRGNNGRRMSLLECLYSTLPCFWHGRQSGFALFFLYLVSKLVYLAVGVGHLHLMRSFLGFPDLAFGWRCAIDLLHGRQWRQTRVFPLVTFCDVPIKHLGRWNTRSVQCVLPLNVFNEKLYIFLWFWTVMCICLTVVSTVVWLVRLFTPKLRQQFIEKYLNKLRDLAVKAKDEEEYRLRKEFVSVFLSLDGLFLLELIEHNAGNVCATEIIFSLYGRYRSHRMRYHTEPHDRTLNFGDPLNQEDYEVPRDSEDHDDQDGDPVVDHGSAKRRVPHVDTNK